MRHRWVFPLEASAANSVYASLDLRESSEPREGARRHVTCLCPELAFSLVLHVTNYTPFVFGGAIFHRMRVRDFRKKACSISPRYAVIGWTSLLCK
ncbi:hypothetical protein NDU88_003547 [Pleurodeles waltl]|uniref:Uncharacterized protein n=1 Tax=Pleurodeles waltl TaxID=8319 RepID=A0AAV7MUL3_PLEWA|nr:hypothetical protein NDU88_003547 [Pleurodeles waltl]